MSIDLRPHQALLDANMDEAKRAGNQNVVAVSPTGSGKTVLFSYRTQKRQRPNAIIAHRSELLGQISFTLSRFYVPHKIIAPPAVIKEINRMQLAKLKRSSYDPNAQCAVVSIQSLNANKERFGPWGRLIEDWITDEGHHVLKDNLWGKGLSLFPNAQGELYTAFPGRGDGVGIGRESLGGKGIVDAMVEGPLMRDLINADYLVDYKIYCPPSDFERSQLDVGKDGEFKKDSVKQATRKSHILGDVVESYIRIAYGLKGITFASDIEDAEDIAAKFRARGVPAAAVSSKTSTPDRIKYLQKFEAGQLLQLVNVDLFGEGYDVPDLQVVSFARPTASFQTYLQQFGRVLRTCEAMNKQYGIVIDHVGNVLAHGLPDAYRSMSLASRPRSSSSKNDPDVLPMRKCLNVICHRAYEAIHPACPYCGTAPVIQDRSRIEHVDGDLYLLDPAMLQQMRIAAEANMSPPRIPHGATKIIEAGIRKKHWEKCQAVDALKESMAWWAGWQQSKGLSLQQCHRVFYYRFGIDVISAQMLNRAEAEELHHKVQDHVTKLSGGKVA